MEKRKEVTLVISIITRFKIPSPNTRRRKANFRRILGWDMATYSSNGDKYGLAGMQNGLVELIPRLEGC